MITLKAYGVLRPDGMLKQRTHTKGLAVFLEEHEARREATGPIVSVTLSYEPRQ